MSDKLQKIVEKIKTNKKIQIMLLGVVVCVILLVYLAYFVVGTSKEETNAPENNVTTRDYVATLERKLEDVISNIEGVGKVNVAITISSDFVYEYAYEDEEKNNLLFANKEPVVLSKKLPEILGVLVVAEGGGNIKVKLDILSCVATLVDVTNENITILNGEF